MNSSYTLKIENSVQALWTGICTFLRSPILSFVNRNSAVFKGLSRLSTPFGGNLLNRD
ncbi:hypothetical protein [Spirosoma koreense]